LSPLGAGYPALCPFRVSTINPAASATYTTGCGIQLPARRYWHESAYGLVIPPVNGDPTAAPDVVYACTAPVPWPLPSSMKPTTTVVDAAPCNGAHTVIEYGSSWAYGGTNCVPYAKDCASEPSRLYSPTPCVGGLPAGEEGALRAPQARRQVVAGHRVVRPCARVAVATAVGDVVEGERVGLGAGGGRRVEERVGVAKRALRRGPELVVQRGDAPQVAACARDIPAGNRAQMADESRAPLR
jgi:hypothetical protein